MMWRLSGKLRSVPRLSIRQFSSLKQSSVSERSIQNVVQKLTKQNTVRYFSTDATGGTVVGGKVLIGAVVATAIVVGGLCYVNNNVDSSKTIEEKTPVTDSKSETELKPPAIPSVQPQIGAAGQLFPREEVTDFEPSPSDEEPVAKRQPPAEGTVEESLFPREVVPFEEATVTS